MKININDIIIIIFVSLYAFLFKKMTSPTVFKYLKYLAYSIVFTIGLTACMADIIGIVTYVEYNDQRVRDVATTTITTSTIILGLSCILWLTLIAFTIPNRKCKGNCNDEQTDKDKDNEVEINDLNVQKDDKPSNDDNTNYVPMVNTPASNSQSNNTNAPSSVTDSGSSSNKPSTELVSDVPEASSGSGSLSRNGSSSGNCSSNNDTLSTGYESISSTQNQ